VVAFTGNEFVDKVARPMVGQRVAIVVDDVVLSAPTINEGITGREVQITGDFAEGEARGLAATLTVRTLLPVSFVAPEPPRVTTTTTAPLTDGPRPNDPNSHWHAALGVNVCGEWLPPAPEFQNRAGTSTRAGLHSHGDGLVHVHPYAEDEAGANATLGRYMEYGGWEIGTDAFRVWDGVTHETGDTCNGVPARVRWTVNGQEQARDPASWKIVDGDVVAVALLPEGEPVGRPPSAGTTPTDLAPSAG
jgi:hypothetical protein